MGNIRAEYRHARQRLHIFFADEIAPRDFVSAQIQPIRRNTENRRAHILVFIFHVDIERILQQGDLFDFRKLRRNGRRIFELQRWRNIRK